MRRLALCTIALAVALATAVTVAQQAGQQAAPASPLDAAMKQIGPALGTSIKSMLSMAYTDARTPLAEVRKGLAGAEAFFAARRNSADAVKLAKDAQAKLDAFDQSLAAAAMVVPTAPTESPLDPLMKKIGPASAAIGKALASRAWADAREQIETARAALVEVESFFATRNTADGVKFAKETLAKLAELDEQLKAPEVDPGTVIATNRQVTTACGACHTPFRIRVNNNFVLKPGSAPTAELITARTALRELQTACTSCHTTYRQVARGEWVLRPGT